MIISVLLWVYLAITQPKPVIVQAVIDSARIIGLPRLKTMDSYLYKIIVIDELHTTPAFAIGTRKEFFIAYFKVGKLTQWAYNKVLLLLLKVSPNEWLRTPA